MFWESNTSLRENSISRFRFFAVCAFLILSLNVFAQKKVKKSIEGQGTVFIELFGNGGLYSLNYDRVFYHKRSNAFTWRAGATFLPPSSLAAEIGVLGEINYLRGKPPHFFEAGLGLTFDKFLQAGEPPVFFLVDRIGYRYQKIGNGFFLRIAFTPLILLGRNREQNIFLHGGLSLGYTFKNKKESNAKRKPQPGRY